MSSEGEDRALLFRLSDNVPEVVRQVLLERSWQEWDEDLHEEYDWNLHWRTTRFRVSDYNQTMSWQRLNHYPKTDAITKKDCLARNLRRMRGVFGPTVYSFSPQAFNLPNDYTKFVAEYTKMKQAEPDKPHFWICKPADMSRGRGIFIFRDLGELTYDCQAVVQRYMTNPLLISGYKFDLRIYVCVPSFHPLTVYIYQEGIVRFSTEKFDLSTIDNVFSHLTNTSINKFSPSYSTDKERVGPGCKWTLSQLRTYFHQSNLDDRMLWQRISNIVTLTLLCQVPTVPKAPYCCELFGFDILIDENMKPWLLEVNFSPALSVDCQADLIVKKPMLHDFVEIMNFKESDCERGGQEFRASKINAAYSASSPRYSRSLRRRGSFNSKQSPSPRAGMFSSMNGKGGKQGSSRTSPTLPPLSPRRGSTTSLGSSTSSQSPSLSGDDAAEEEEGDGSHGDSNHGEGEDESRLEPIKEGHRTDYTSPRTTPVQNPNRRLSLPDVQSQTPGQRKRIPFQVRREKSKSHKITTATAARRAQMIEEQRIKTKSAPTTDQLANNGSISPKPANQEAASNEEQGSASTNDSKSSEKEANENIVEESKAGSKDVSTEEDTSAVTNTNNPTQAKASVTKPKVQTPRRRYSYPLNRQSNPSAQVGNPGVNRTDPGRRVSLSSTPTSMTSSRPRRPLYQRTTNVTQDSENKNRNQGPLPRVGDFILTYPFNEATKKASWPNVDQRSIIRELQKQLRQTLKHVQTCKTQRTTQDIITGGNMMTNIYGQGQVEESMRWGPVALTTMGHG
ncbi:TTLL2 [Branchiostoma lanceolatum]|uniref:TTLL2 protein n=1 Tax=Branchiostoma lanceolatum TaxID=7740 RepID=A0A8J9YNI8_BRALA|nr:TTLL2 [Branchiostoma lanceolatum]